jgi:hypothetical protein
VEEIRLVLQIRLPLVPLVPLVLDLKLALGQPGPVFDLVSVFPELVLMLVVELLLVGQLHL